MKESVGWLLVIALQQQQHDHYSLARLCEKSSEDEENARGREICQIRKWTLSVS